LNPYLCLEVPLKTFALSLLIFHSTSLATHVKLCWPPKHYAAMVNYKGRSYFSLCAYSPIDSPNSNLYYGAPYAFLYKDLQ
jgi:hypothetical protein